MDDSQTEEFAIWSTVTTVAPIVFPSAAWIIGRFVLGYQNSFVETFGTGDLLPLAAVIMLVISTDIRHESRVRKIGSAMVYAEFFFLICALVAVAAYGSLKARGIQLLKVPDVNGDATLESFAIFSWACLGATSFHASVVKHRLINGRRRKK